MKFKSILAVTLLAVGATAMAPAVALPVAGGVSFGDGFTSTGTTNSIVSLLTSVGISTPEGAFGCTGDFATGLLCVPPSGTFASSFVIGTPSTMFAFDGFSFATTGFSNVFRGAFTCNGVSCSDMLSFNGTGTVTKAGFDPSVFLLTWTAQGGCTESSATSNLCGGNVTASWSASITAIGQVVRVPEPNALALLGLGLGMLGFMTRSRKI
jgi:PEP-CTERM motif